MDWDEAWRSLLPTLLLAPLVWSATIGRRQPPRLIRGLGAGRGAWRRGG